MLGRAETVIEGKENTGHSGESSTDNITRVRTGDDKKAGELA